MHDISDNMQIRRLISSLFISIFSSAIKKIDDDNSESVFTNMNIYAEYPKHTVFFMQISIVV